MQSHPFWSKLTLNFLLNNFSPTFLHGIVVVILPINTIKENIFLKPLKGNTNISGKLSCHQIGVRLHSFFCSVCYNLSKIFSFLSLNVDFIIANSADPYEMTHHVTFYLGFPCPIKYPIREFWYTKGIQRLSISYIRVQKLPCFTTDQIRYSFYCGRFSPFLSNDERV